MIGLDAAEKRKLTTAIFSRRRLVVFTDRFVDHRVDIINKYLFLARFHRSSFSGYAYPTRARCAYTNSKNNIILGTSYNYMSVK